MNTDELWAILKPEIVELKSDVKDICRDVKRINGDTQRNKWNVKAIWTVFTCAWVVFLLWLRSALGEGQ